MQAKRIAVSFLAILFLFGANPAYAAAPASEGPTSVSTISIVTPFAEETKWFYRVQNGVLQKRLWSYTQGIWLTGWVLVV